MTLILDYVFKFWRYSIPKTSPSILQSKILLYAISYSHFLLLKQAAYCILSYLILFPTINLYRHFDAVTIIFF